MVQGQTGRSLRRVRPAQFPTFSLSNNRSYLPLSKVKPETRLGLLMPASMGSSTRLRAILTQVLFKKERIGDTQTRQRGENRKSEYENSHFLNRRFCIAHDCGMRGPRGASRASGSRRALRIRAGLSANPELSGPSGIWVSG